MSLTPVITSLRCARWRTKLIPPGSSTVRAASFGACCGTLSVKLTDGCPLANPDQRPPLRVGLVLVRPGPLEPVPVPPPLEPPPPPLGAPPPAAGHPDTVQLEGAVSVR